MRRESCVTAVVYRLTLLFVLLVLGIALLATLDAVTYLTAKQLPDQPSNWKADVPHKFEDAHVGPCGLVYDPKDPNDMRIGYYLFGESGVRQKLIALFTSSTTVGWCGVEASGGKHAVPLILPNFTAFTHAKAEAEKPPDKLCEEVQEKDVVVWGSSAEQECTASCIDAFGQTYGDWRRYQCLLQDCSGKPGQYLLILACLKVGVASTMHQKTSVLYVILTFVVPLFYLGLVCFVLLKSVGSSRKEQRSDLVGSAVMSTDDAITDWRTGRPSSRGFIKYSVRQSPQVDPDSDKQFIEGFGLRQLHQCIHLLSTRCGLSCKFESDAQHEFWMLGKGAITMLTDPVLDILTIKSYCTTGQPAFAFITLCGVFSDPLCRKLTKAMSESYGNGFRGRAYWTYMQSEGGFEAFLGSAIAYLALLTIPAEAARWQVALPLLLNILNGFFVTLPSSFKAWRLLNQSVDDVDNYYEVGRFWQRRRGEGDGFLHLIQRSSDLLLSLVAIGGLSIARLFLNLWLVTLLLAILAVMEVVFHALHYPYPEITARLGVLYATVIACVTAFIRKQPAYWHDELPALIMQVRQGHNLFSILQLMLIVVPLLCLGLVALLGLCFACAHCPGLRRLCPRRAPPRYHAVTADSAE